jgi:hypothetical protein
MGLGRTVCGELLGDKIEAYTGYVFEECARQFMLKELGRGTFNFTDLVRKSKLFHQFNNRQYILFSKSAFTGTLGKKAYLVLVRAKDMF